MSSNLFNLEDQLKFLTSNKKWEDVIELGNKIPTEQKLRYIWAWPDKKSLSYLKQILIELKIGSILSIGCGSGLLEWLIIESTGIQVSGVEVDENWWTSKHSPLKFIELNYIKTQITPEFLENCAITKNFALCFCYFNNQEAFDDYIRAYNGNCLIIIGPSGKSGKQIIFTEPAPFDLGLKSSEYNWILFNFCEIIGTDNYIAIYTR